MPKSRQIRVPQPPEPVKRVLKEVTQPGLVHPALIPGIGVEQTGRTFPTNRVVFAVAGALIVAVIGWAIVAPDEISVVGGASLAWVTERFGWMSPTRADG